MSERSIEHLGCQTDMYSPRHLLETLRLFRIMWAYIYQVSIRDRYLIEEIRYTSIHVAMLQVLKCDQ